MSDDDKEVVDDIPDNLSDPTEFDVDVNDDTDIFELDFGGEDED